MGGLGNGRRGGRSPPLLIGALVACVLVLGFNYWMSSSRNLELQAKLYELDGKVRRGAAEQEVAEMKRSQFQEEIQRQKEQMGHIESLFKRQMEGAQNTCSQEKVLLQHNISSSAKAIEDLKGQLNQLTDDLGKLQKELQSCHGNINNLNNKLTYDMTHCNSQVLAQKELCDERVAAAKIEIQKKMEKLILSSSFQENAATEIVEEYVPEPKNQASNVAVVPSTTKDVPELDHQKIVKSPDVLANKDIAAKDPDSHVDLAEGQTAVETHSVVTTTQKHEILPAPEEDGGKEEDNGDTGNETDDDHNNNKDGDDNAAGDDHEAGNDTGNEEEQDAGEGKVDHHLAGMELMDDNKEKTEDNGVHGMQHDEANDDQQPADHKLDEQDDYDTEDQVVGDTNHIKGQNADQGPWHQAANYNGDDENEGESEADKQAALAQL